MRGDRGWLAGATDASGRVPNNCATSIGGCSCSRRPAMTDDDGDRLQLRSYAVLDRTCTRRRRCRQRTASPELFGEQTNAWFTPPPGALVAHNPLGLGVLSPLVPNARCCLGGQVNTPLTMMENLQGSGDRIDPTEAAELERMQPISDTVQLGPVLMPATTLDTRWHGSKPWSSSSALRLACQSNGPR